MTLFILFRLISPRPFTQHDLWQRYRLLRNQTRTGWDGWRN